MSEKPRKYVLTLTEDQARAISFSSELVSRLYMGQLDSISSLSFSKDNWEEINDLIKKLRLAMGMVPVLQGYTNENAYWGITSSEIPNRSRTLFDIYQVIRHQLWKDTPDAPNHTVCASRAFQTDHSQELPEIS